MYILRGHCLKFPNNFVFLSMKFVFGLDNSVDLFVSLCPKSRAMVMAGRSVHLITLFPGQA